MAASTRPSSSPSSPSKSIEFINLPLVSYTNIPTNLTHNFNLNLIRPIGTHEGVEVPIPGKPKSTFAENPDLLKVMATRFINHSSATFSFEEMCWASISLSKLTSPTNLQSGLDTLSVNRASNGAELFYQQTHPMNRVCSESDVNFPHNFVSNQEFVTGSPEPLPHILFSSEIYASLGDGEIPVTPVHSDNSEVEVVPPQLIHVGVGLPILIQPLGIVIPVDNVTLPISSDVAAQNPPGANLVLNSISNRSSTGPIAFGSSKAIAQPSGFVTTIAPLNPFVAFMNFSMLGNLGSLFV